MKQDKSNSGLSQAALGQAILSPDAKVLALPRVSSEILFSGSQQLVIEHAGEEYQLRITKQGKLILTK
ncbi:MAG TPA: hemin uptake protein HemP [Methylophilaceae bacterium]|jgi:hemin uptake protein HemP